MTRAILRSLAHLLTLLAILCGWRGDEEPNVWREV
jgi:hypothetical protein